MDDDPSCVDRLKTKKHFIGNTVLDPTNNGCDVGKATSPIPSVVMNEYKPTPQVSSTNWFAAGH